MSEAETEHPIGGIITRYVSGEMSFLALQAWVEETIAAGREATDEESWALAYLLNTFAADHAAFLVETWARSALLQEMQSPSGGESGPVA
jgi:hypothetical protein